MNDNSNARDALAALPIILLGGAAAWFARPFRFGSLLQMGPGFLPTVVAYLLIGIGLLIACQRRGTDEPGDAARAARAIVFVLGAMLAFAGLIERAGVVAATITATAICVFATPEARWKEALPLGAGFAAFAVLVFVYGLGQPIPVWWWGP